jgi:ABC-type multidrug transport system fused ATPase/permease subunit
MKLSKFRGVTTLGIREAFSFLEPKDTSRLALFSLVQVFLSFLDLFGIALIGVLVTLASADEIASPPRYVEMMLKLTQIDDLATQTQILAIGCMAALLLSLKSLGMTIVLRKNAFFLSHRSAEISRVLISKLLSSSLADLNAKSIQQYMYAVTGGVSYLTSGVIARCVGLIGDIATVATVLIGLLVLNSSIALASTLIFGLIGLILFLLLQKRAKNAGREQSELSIQGGQEIFEVLGSFREVFVKNRGHFYAQSIGNTRLSLSSIQAKMFLMNIYSKYVIEASITFGALLVALIQLYLLDGPQAISSLGLFLASALRLAPAVLRLQNNLIEIRSALSGTEETVQLNRRLKNLSLSQESSQTPSVNYQGFVPSVTFESVTFTYEKSTVPALSDVTFSIEAGTFCAIIGESGAGKSTLVDTMLGINRQDQGKVFISGVSPIEAIRTWPGAIAYVPQDVQIIRGTIRENMSLGYTKSFFPDDLYSRALALSRLDEFVNNQPLGLETQVGDRGVNLSGGQRQRLGIARAMLTQPQLLVLDEATSALDSETESEFVEALQQLRGKVTLVVIAHRLSTLASANVIYQMREGTLNRLEELPSSRSTTTRKGTHKL